MKLYKDSNNQIWAYEPDGSQDHLIGDKTPITAAEAEQLRNQKQQDRYNSLSYAEKRRLEYPPIGDQLDALWKGGAEAQAMLEKIQAVKAKHPK